MRVLSAGAVQRGLEAVAATFERESGQRISLAFATAPVIRGKIEQRNAPVDVVVAPRELMLGFARQELIASETITPVGDVKAGVAVGPGDWRPDISTAQALKDELLRCAAVVYTEGSSGVFAEHLLQRLGIADGIKHKTHRLPDAGAVMSFLAANKDLRAIGFGQLTAIALHEPKGVRLVGALPAGVESITSYVAALTTSAEEPAAAQRFLALLATPSSRAALRAAGIS